jgi:hypothetical protein
MAETSLRYQRLRDIVARDDCEGLVIHCADRGADQNRKKLRNHILAVFEFDVLEKGKLRISESPCLFTVL